MIAGEQTHVRNILMGERTLCKLMLRRSRGGERTCQRDLSGLKIMTDASYEEATDEIFSLDKFADTTTSYIANIIQVVKITTIIQYYLLHL